MNMSMDDVPATGATTTTEEPTTDEPQRFEVEVPDDSLDELLANIRVVDNDDDVASGEPFEVKKAKYNNWDEMEAVASLKSGEGVWQAIDCLASGSEVRFGDVRAFSKRQEALERRFRAKNPKYNKKGKSGNLPKLPDETNLDIFVAAAYGTSILDWRGPGFERSNGEKVPFNRENFAKACTEFDELGLELGMKMGSINPTALEAIRKN